MKHPLQHTFQSNYNPQAIAKGWEKEMAKLPEEMNRPIPTVRDEKSAWDLFSKLLEKRIIRLDGPVDDGMAAVACSALQYLNDKAPGEEIQVIINSPGGSVYAGLAIYDTMRSIEAPVHTVCNGLAASMGSLLLCGGDKRFATPNSCVMIHQPLGGNGQRTQAEDMEVNSESIMETYDRLVKIYIAHTGVDAKHWPELLTRDNFLSADEAKDLNLIDGIIAHKKQAPYAEMAEKADMKAIRDEFNVINTRKTLIETIRDEREAAKAAKASNDNSGAETAQPAAKKAAKGPSAGQ